MKYLWVWGYVVACLFLLFAAVFYSAIVYRILYVFYVTFSPLWS